MNIKSTFLLIAVGLVFGVGGATLYFTQVPKAQTQNDISAEQTAAIIAKVGKLIVLPEGETPTIATVSDPEKLKDQPFFANAKAGDKVLVYTNAKEAFLYDPVDNKLLNVAPLNISSDIPPSASTTTSSQNATHTTATTKTQ